MRERQRAAKWEVRPSSDLRNLSKVKVGLSGPAVSAAAPVVVAAAAPVRAGAGAGAPAAVERPIKADARLATASSRNPPFIFSSRRPNLVWKTHISPPTRYSC